VSKFLVCLRNFHIILSTICRHHKKLAHIADTMRKLLVSLHIYHIVENMSTLQGSEDAWDALNCRSLCAKELLIIGLFVKNDL